MAEIFGRKDSTMKSWQDWLKPPNLYYVIVGALLLAWLYFF
jgi:hypothetical protein